MNTQKTAALMAVYGSMLIVLGVLYMLSDGFKLKTEVLMTVLVGIASWGISFFMLRRQGWAFWGGLFVTFGMIIVMGWLTLKALYQLIDMIQNDIAGNPYDDGISFLLVLSAYVVSILVAIIQVMLARSNARELLD